MVFKTVDRDLSQTEATGRCPVDWRFVVSPLKAKNAENLQQKFNEVVKEAELKFLDATIEALQLEEQQTKQRYTEEKQKVLTAIEDWRSSFKASDSSLDIDADQFVISAKSFADDFYFECAAERTSKRVAENIKKASKAAKSAERMETKFTVNEQSIKDMVQRAVRQELNKHKPVSPPTKETSVSHKISRSPVKVIDPTLEAVKMTDPAPKIESNAEILAKVVTEAIPHLPTIAHKTDAADQNNGERENHALASLEASLLEGDQKMCEAAETVS